jgi:hypothetical protein
LAAVIKEFGSLLCPRVLRRQPLQFVIRLGKEVTQFTDGFGGDASERDGEDFGLQLLNPISRGDDKWVI